MDNKKDNNIDSKIDNNIDGKVKNSIDNNIDGKVKSSIDNNTDSNIENMVNTARISDRELKEKITEQQKDSKSGIRIMIIAGVVFVLGLIAGAISYFSDISSLIMFPLLIVLFVGATIILVIGSGKDKNAKMMIKHYISENIATEALLGVFTDLLYNSEASFTIDFIKETDLIPYQFNKLLGSDYVKAKYKDLDIEMSDINLKIIEERRDNKNKPYEVEIEIFNGLWLVCDLGKEFSADLMLQEKNGNIKIAEYLIDRTSNVKVENLEFNDKFLVIAENEQEAFEILTPQMMECIAAIDKKAEGVLYMKFMRNGQVHIAINSGRNSFEPSFGENEVNFDELLEQFVSEIQYITDIIDELMLVR